ncbi:MAG TPA: type II toxin-antitoxin system HicB family antitoxin [Rhodanobacter sp.]|nr:type II toxin-antitoxin system HicB family antitoxin [Rhodanobacter sp.]
MKYPVRLQHLGDDEIMVTCPDLPAMTSVGTGKDDALRQAVDGIASALQILINDRQAIPKPSAPKRGMKLVELPPLAVAKIGLYRAMLQHGIRKSELARRLQVHLPQIDRLIDLRHKSKLDQVQAALEAVGYRMEIKVMAA